MKRRKLFFTFLTIAGLALTGFTTLQAGKSKSRMILIGDSTVKNGSGDGRNLQWGWGDQIACYFDTSRITVINRAIGGRSSRTFISEGRWENLLTEIRAGDYLLIQFGHNDASPVNDTSHARGTLKGVGEETEEIDNLLTKKHEIVHTYGWYLRQYIADARAKGATPVLISPVPRDNFDNGKTRRNATSYGGWAKQVAEAENVPFIDLNALVADEYDNVAARLGEAAIGSLYFHGDHTHTSLAGARLNASKVIEGIKTLKNCSLKDFLPDKTRTLDKKSPAAPRASEREKYNFNSRWTLHVGDAPRAHEVKFDDASWKKVTLPAAFNEDEAFRVSIAEHTDTVVWYRKHFRLPRTARGQKIFLEFEGIRFGGEFWVNGQPVGLHENGVMAFGFDITDRVNYNGDNVIAARIDNSWSYKERSTGSTYQWNDRNFYANFGGIPKNVYLHVAPRLYQTLPLYSNLQTTGTYIYASEIDIARKNAMIHAESEIRNEFPSEKTFVFEVTIEDLDGKIIKTMSAPAVKIKAGETLTVRAADRVGNLNFWGWGHGYLYTVYTALKVNGAPLDVVKTRTGFRKTRFANGLFWLNDRVLQIKGYAERSTNEWPAVGASVPAWLSDYSNRLMVESNANTVRWMHVTPWKQDVESCDRVGLIQLLPAGDSEKDVDGRRWEHRVAVMRDAIIYNRNNPSVIFYEGGNESISEEHMAELKAVRDRHDPHGGRAIGSREMLDSKIAEWGGEMLYINKSARHPLFATEYCRDEALRWYWDELSYPYHKEGEGSKYYHSTVTNTVQTNVDARPYNRNQDSFFKELITRWWDYYRVRPGTGKRVSSGGLKIQFHEVNSHWRGQENYRRSGVVDAMRVPKDAFFAHQVMWNGWVDIEKHGTYICGHWNYTDDIVKEVMVASTGEKVELFVNGESKGFGERTAGFLFTFHEIRWEPGTIEAVSYDADGHISSKNKKETAGQPDHITLKLMTAPDGFKADGSDLVLVEIEVVDQEGRRCPLANDMISFDLQGEAEWRGGIAHGGKEGNYILEKALPVECGVNRILIRSTTHPGNIRLTATAVDLSPATLSFHSTRVAEKHGLSTYIPGEHQPVNLSRGATPPGESFTVKRHAVDIIAATAGSNEADVAKSFDDNELSEWSNDGHLSTGWIKYELARDALVNEIELKLTGWRSRSYPIQIFVDGAKVFEGETPKSLGYISIPVTPTRGRFVGIKLIGQGKDKDAFSGIVEVEAATAGELDLLKDPATTRQKGQLRIVEAEIYEEIKN